jgi:hypothetical protein
MTDHKTATREQWLAARLELLEAEKEFTRRRDELTRRRMAMPWERVEKSYQFELSRQQWLKANAHFLGQGEAGSRARMTHPHRPVVYRNVAHCRALRSRPQSRRLR